jgi:riboflavin kinase/FMN adenylyltransferase
MRIIEGLDGLAALDLEKLHGRARESRSAVMVGVFDGVHLGHQRMVHELLEMASNLDAVPSVITFADHPDRLLRGEAPPLIVSVPHRLRLLRRAGVQRAVLLQFDERVREMPPERFAADVLGRGLGTRGLLLGFDSALGKDRAGTPARFRELGDELGFTVRVSEPFLVDGAPVSSTAIRDAITRGDLQKCNRLLGRHASAFGTVIAGDGRGRKLGFPTANLVPQSTVLPPPGVYAVLVIHDGETYPGIANLGRRPTVARADATAPLLLEAHLFDHDEDLYGKAIEVCFVAFLREERQFAGLDELRAQIAADKAQACAVLDYAKA